MIEAISTQANTITNAAAAQTKAADKTAATAAAAAVSAADNTAAANTVKNVDTLTLSKEAQDYLATESNNADIVDKLSESNAADTQDSTSTAAASSTDTSTDDLSTYSDYELRKMLINGDISNQDYQNEMTRREED